MTGTSYLMHFLHKLIGSYQAPASCQQSIAASICQKVQKALRSSAFDSANLIVRAHYSWHFKKNTLAYHPCYKFPIPPKRFWVVCALEVVSDTCPPTKVLYSEYLSTFLRPFGSPQDVSIQNPAFAYFLLPLFQRILKVDIKTYRIKGCAFHYVIILTYYTHDSLFPSATPF